MEVPNPFREKDFTMIKTGSHASPPGTISGQAPLRPAFPPIHSAGFRIALAADMRDLQECLALERFAGSRIASGSEGIQSPPAVPYCEFLTVRAADGALQAVCRLMRIDRDNPLAHPLKAGRFHLSPLLTAMRYSREGVLEMGAPVFAPGAHPEKLAGLLWTGLIRYLERNGLGFVLGLEALPQPPVAAKNWGRLMEDHGLHPDLEVEARSAFRSGPFTTGIGFLADSRESSPDGSDAVGERANDRAWESTGEASASCRASTANLSEALRRGCRLASEPAYDPATGSLLFLWVASRDMLQGGDTGDWRGAASA
jgi:hypothetical protein